MGLAGVDLAEGIFQSRSEFVLSGESRWTAGQTDGWKSTDGQMDESRRIIGGLRDGE